MQHHLDRLGKLASMAKLAYTKTTREILFILHNSVADSSAWRTPRLYRTQQDPSLKNYESTGCQWYSKLHCGLLQPTMRL